MNALSLFVLLITLVPARLSTQETAPYPAPPKDVSSVSMVAPAGEPGERLVITGTVYRSDGKTPYAGMVLYLYQTDNSGVYNTTTGSWQSPRLHGWIKTDKSGKYKINTIKPGAYPRRRDPAHIHVIVQLLGEQPKWIDDFLFDEDPYLSDQDRKQSTGKGTFSHVLKTWREPDGLLRAVRDIALR